MSYSLTDFVKYLFRYRKNEIKLALLVILTFIVLFVGYNFLKNL